MKKRQLVSIVTIAASALFTGCGGKADHGHDGENIASETAHAEHSTETPGAHEEDDADMHEERGDEHESEDEIVLTPEFIKMAGITFAKVERGRIAVSIDLSGVVGFNEDRLVHVTPRFSGIAREVKFRVGEYVNEGDVAAIIESNESLTHYSVKAPISGRIIEKHISPGEHVSNEESIYLLADLSTVWVNLAVYPKDVAKIRQGQQLSITAVGSDITTDGAIAYIAPIVDRQTRRITARVVVQNKDAAWRPGSFVNARLVVDEGGEGLVIDKAAVQIVDNKQVVFIQHEPGSFKPVEVTTGGSDDRHVHILEGLTEGAEYVGNGAFELKAKIVTSSLGSHAGHGH